MEAGESSHDIGHSRLHVSTASYRAKAYSASNAVKRPVFFRARCFSCGGYNVPDYLSAFEGFWRGESTCPRRSSRRWLLFFSIDVQSGTSRED